MNLEPRTEADYSARQTAAARRVLVDLGQVLASFVDCLVVVGGVDTGLVVAGCRRSVHWKHGCGLGP